MRILFLLILFVLGSALATDNYKVIGSYFVTNLVPQSQLQIFNNMMTCFAACTSLGSGCNIVAVVSSAWCSLYSTSSVAYSIQLANSTNTTVWQKQGSSIPPIYVWTTSYDPTLAHYWPIQSNDTLELIKGQHLTCSDPVLVSNHFGVANSAVRIDPLVPNSFFTIPSGFYLNGGGPFSMVLWIRMISCYDHMQLIEFTDPSYSEYFSVVLQTGTCRPFSIFYVLGDQYYQTDANWGTSQPLPVGTWTQLALTFEPTNTRVNIFINGTQVSTSANSSPALNNVTYTVNRVGISNVLGFTKRLNAEIDELKLYNRVLSSSDLASDLRKADSYLIPL